MPSRLRKAPKRDLIGGTELEKQLHKKRMYAKTKRDTKDEIARTQHYLTYVPNDPEALEHLAQTETYLKEDARPNYAKAETEVMSRFHGYGIQKRPNETEDAYQQRLLRTQQQTERLAKAGITPEARQTAIQASAKVRQLKQMRDVVAQEASQQAYEQDPRTIAKRDAIAKREQENAIFNPLLKGLVDVAKAGSDLSFLPSQLREVGSMTADYLGSTMAEEEARTQQRLAEREAKMASVADYNADLARQREMAGNVSVSDLDRQIAEQQRLASRMPRFGEARYF